MDHLFSLSAVDEFGLLAGSAGLVVLLAALAGWALRGRMSPAVAPAVEVEQPPPPQAGINVLIEGGAVRLDAGSAPWPGAEEAPETLQALLGWAGSLAPAQADALADLAETGAGFEDVVRAPDGAIWQISGRPDGFRARLQLKEAGPAVARLYADLADRAELEGETAHNLARAQAGPVPAFEVDDADRVTWYNRAASELLDVGLGSDSLRAVPPVREEGRIALRNRQDQVTGWAQVRSTRLSTGRRLITVADANAEHRAEEMLQSFVATLTETFAHLDLALVIFDADNRLSLFNPAVADLFGLNPAQLALKPGLREFLDMLRGQRMVPEQVNFARWRKDIMHRFAAISDERYSEDWTLVSDQVIRVNAMPHPGGALALIFEDISREVMLERKFMAEIELNQTVLDQLTDGLAIVALSGDVIFANQVFTADWGISADREGLEAASLSDITAALRPAVRDPGELDRLRAFLLGHDRTAHCETRLHGGEQGAMVLRASALPDGSTMLLSTPLREPQMRGPRLADNQALNGPGAPANRDAREQEPRPARSTG